MAELMWKPSVELSKAQELIYRRLKRVGRLFAFLRKHRHRLLETLHRLDFLERRAAAAA